MKKILAVTGIAVGAVAIIAGVITLIRDGRDGASTLAADEDGLARRMVEEGESVVRLQNAA